MIAIVVIFLIIIIVAIVLFCIAKLNKPEYVNEYFRESDNYSNYEYGAGSYGHSAFSSETIIRSGTGSDQGSGTESGSSMMESTVFTADQSMRAGYYSE
jgi:hypothetical protein